MRQEKYGKKRNARTKNIKLYNIKHDVRRYCAILPMILHSKLHSILKLFFKFQQEYPHKRCGYWKQLL